MVPARVFTMVASTLPVATVANSTANGLGRVKYQLASAVALTTMARLINRSGFLIDGIIR